MLNRISYILLLGLLTICAFLYITFLRKESQPPARFVGIDRCRVCHESARFGAQFPIWSRSAHARAYATLQGDSARQYLQMHGGKIDSCLACHATLGRRTKVQAEEMLLVEGVGCERCHGAGSNYSDFITMTDHPAFVARGGISGSLGDCNQCHAPEPGSGIVRCPFDRAPFRADSAWRRIAHPSTGAAITWDTILRKER